MPVRQCPNGKWQIGNGRCEYPTKAVAERAYRGYLAHKYATGRGAGGGFEEKVAELGRMMVEDRGRARKRR